MKLKEKLFDARSNLDVEIDILQGVIEGAIKTLEGGGNIEKSTALALAVQFDRLKTRIKEVFEIIEK